MSAVTIPECGRIKRRSPEWDRAKARLIFREESMKLAKQDGLVDGRAAYKSRSLIWTDGSPVSRRKSDSIYLRTTSDLHWHLALIFLALCY